jgi:hypothetical protein
MKTAEPTCNLGGDIIPLREVSGIDVPSVSAFLSSLHFDYSLKVEALDITSDLTKTVLYSKVS